MDLDWYGFVLKWSFEVCLWSFFSERREGEEEKKMGREGEMMTPWERESIVQRI